MLEIDARFAGMLAQAGLETRDAIIERFAQGIQPRGRSPTVRPDQIVLPDGRQLPVHYKHYEYGRPAWVFVGRRSKAHREFLNYRVFASLRLAVPETLAWGEARALGGGLRSAFIITRTIPDAVTLPEFWERLAQHPSPRAAAAQRTVLLHRLADDLRRLHGAHFYHNDLVWRNFLVTWEPPTDATLWWIDCPRGGFERCPPLRRHRQTKDLALLDRQAAIRCTPRERLQFLRRYLRASGRDPRVGQLARAVSRYAHRRWPHRLPQPGGTTPPPPPPAAT